MEGQVGDVRTAMHASLRLLELDPASIVYPVWTAIWRTPTRSIHPSATLVYFVGDSGALKSTVAALLLGHFGDFASHTGLPAHFEDTDNAVETLRFLAAEHVANLALGLDLGLDFAVQVEALSEAEALETGPARLAERKEGGLAVGQQSPEATKVEWIDEDGIFAGAGGLIDTPPGHSFPPSLNRDAARD